MQLLAKKNGSWVDIVCSFGCDKQLAEDIVQEMYIKIQLKLEKGLDISYGDNDINYYYIFRTLHSLFIDLKRKTNKIYKVDIEHIAPNLIASTSIKQEVNFEEKYDLVKKELNKMYWYDKKVFELINKGESIAQLSRKTGIQYYSLYNTYKKVKEKLKKLL